MTVRLAPTLSLPGLTLRRRVDINQIHVRAVIELMRAEFAHPDHNKFRLDPGTARVSMHRGPMDCLEILIDNFIGGMDEDRCKIG
jgi:hypothetical protein